MINKYKLTVGIISYNRPLELARTLNSLLPLPDDVEVLICDDKSPKIDQINDSIIDIVNNNTNIRFENNTINLGYDKNLFNVIEGSNSPYVLLLGDDDYLEPGALENLVDFLNNSNDFKCGFLRFKSISEINYHRESKKHIYYDSKYISLSGSFVYNAILFSGLIFHKDSVISNNDILKKYFNSIYIQVAIFAFLNKSYGSYNISGPGVIIGGDGESGFGFNEASANNDLDLKDRSSIISNIAYHKRLFEVINKIDIDINQSIYKAFTIEYKIRSIKAMYIAKKQDNKYLKLYWQELRQININGMWTLSPFYFFIYITPLEILNNIFKFSEIFFFKFRDFKNSIK
jgi:hypothetical protein